MRDRYLVEFIADFLRSEDLRSRVLKDEVEGPRAYGLDDDQLAALATFDLDQIFGLAKEEILAAGINLPAKLREMQKGEYHRPKPVVSGMFHAMYPGGGIHIRNVIPSKVKVGIESEVVIEANGLDPMPQIGFSKEAIKLEPDVEGKVISFRADPDLFQRVGVLVSLPEAGTWVVQARNSPAEPWTNMRNVATLTAER